MLYEVITQQAGSALAYLLALLDDRDDLVRFTTAELLARRDDADGLRTLGELLDSKQPVVRARSIQRLRSVETAGNVRP